MEVKANPKDAQEKPKSRTSAIPKAQPRAPTKLPNLKENLDNPIRNQPKNKPHLVRNSKPQAHLLTPTPKPAPSTKSPLLKAPQSNKHPQNLPLEKTTTTAASPALRVRNNHNRPRINDPPPGNNPPTSPAEGKEGRKTPRGKRR